MFQAQRIVSDKCWPVSYMVAPKKKCQLVWRNLLNQMATFGNDNGGIFFLPSLWTGSDWRPILGTWVDTRILPPPLSAKEHWHHVCTTASANGKGAYTGAFLE